MIDYLSAYISFLGNNSSVEDWSGIVHYMQSSLLMTLMFINIFLLFAKNLNFIVVFVVLALSLTLGNDLIPSQLIIKMTGQLFSERFAETNTESAKYILLLLTMLPHVTLIAMKSYRSVARFVMVVVSLAFLFTTTIFHFGYFHGIQSVTIIEHSRLPFVVSTMTEKDFAKACNSLPIKCYSNLTHDSTDLIGEPWVLAQFEKQIVPETRYANGKTISEPMLKTNILGGGAEVVWVRYQSESDWRIVISEEILDPITNSLQIHFWLQTLIAHFIWLTLGLFVIYRHEQYFKKKAFKQ